MKFLVYSKNGCPYCYKVKQVLELTGKQFVEYKNLWEDLGASIIGGCCGLGPDYIKAIA